VKKLGEIATFSKGKGISKSEIEENGITECIRYGELYTHYREVINEIKSRTNVDKSALVLSEENDVIIPASGETTIDIATASCVLKPGIALGGDLNIIKSKNDGVFLSYYLNSKKKMEIANLAQGISVVHLYSSQLASLSLSLPTNQEQEKISTFLAKISERIDCSIKIINDLKTLKTATAKKIFSQELRFKDDNGNDFPEWEVREVGEVFKITRGNVLAMNLVSNQCNEKNTYPVYSSQTKNNGLAGYYTDFLFEDAITWTTDGANAGDVNYRSGKFYCTNVCGVLISNEGYANSCIAELINSVSKNYVSYVGNPKLMNGVMSEIKIPFPSLPEQTKIANFLSAIDSKIDMENQLLQKLEEQKKYLLQNMFV
jgi:type I restriction enzyme S subunit